jgi:hypothetical protein
MMRVVEKLEVSDVTAKITVSAQLQTPHTATRLHFLSS